ncbi:hypothetical protein AMTR_s00063p00184810 [Amborella trichopoda]|uniref:Uncharacterized protein n=1 Tax=Amborella trichopoda TaxID=13333 RepID=U5D4D2_AMBTC|nr:hypothetical protein AMTR_s00063p00184810 [Amborella trichopoda]
MLAPAVPHRLASLKARFGSGRSGSCKECSGSKGSVSHSAPAVSKHDLAVHVLEVLLLRKFQC